MSKISSMLHSHSYIARKKTRERKAKEKKHANEQQCTSVLMPARSYMCVYRELNLCLTSLLHNQAIQLL